MPIRDELRARWAAVQKRFPRADLAVVEETIEGLRQRQLAEHSLREGELFPDFALPDGSGRTVTSAELLDRGPVVLAFFRGAWCPYCDVALRGLEAARPAIEEVGAALVGVSPTRPDELRRIAEERGLGFPLLSDVDGRLAGLCGVAYEISAAHVDFYRRLGIDMEELHAGAGWQLPLPATYVINRDAIVRYVFVDPDWAYRAEPEDLVAVVRAEAQAAGAAAAPG